MMSTSPDFVPLEGGCDCKQVRYRLLDKPLFVHCCLCRWCQRESGSAFALNAMVESKNVQSITTTTPEKIVTPSESGKSQVIARCPSCKIAVWSNYGGLSDILRFVRVGSLDDPDNCPPDIQIYAASKQPWLKLNDDIPAVEGWYDREKYWPKESLARLELAFPKDEGNDDELVKETAKITL